MQKGTKVSSNLCGWRKKNIRVTLDCSRKTVGVSGFVSQKKNRNRLSYLETAVVAATYQANLMNHVQFRNCAYL